MTLLPLLALGALHANTVRRPVVAVRPAPAARVAPALRRPAAAALPRGLAPRIPRPARVSPAPEVRPARLALPGLASMGRGVSMARSESDSQVALDLGFLNARAGLSAEPIPVSSARSLRLAAPAPDARPEPAQAPVPKPAGRLRKAAPNILTAGNFAAGFTAIALLAMGQVPLAVGLIATTAALIKLAMILDLADGKLARWLGVDGPFGVEFDSLADVVSFGVAPAVLLLKTALLPLGLWGIPAAAAFALAGALRLARYNVGAHAAAGKPSPFFTGMPIPAGAGAALALAVMTPFVASAWLTPIAVGATLLTAAAMVSTLPYFKPGGGAVGLLPVAAASTIIGGAVWAAGFPFLVPAALFSLFALSGPLVWVYRGGSDQFRWELRRKAVHLSQLLYIPAFLILGAPLFVGLMVPALAFMAWLERRRMKSGGTYGGLTREHEKNRLAGSFYGGLGTFIAAAAFGSNPAAFIAAVLFLAVGDSVSSLVRLRFGLAPFTLRGKPRSIGGALAGLAVAMASAAFLGFPLWIAALGALAFSFADIVPIKPDDNFWIPVLGGAALFFLSAL